MRPGLTDPSQLELLRVEFSREQLRLTDQPLQFVVHELGAIIERMPADLALDVHTANKIIVTITTE